MLAAGARSGTHSVKALLMRCQREVTVTATVDSIANTDTLGALPVRLTPVSLVYKDLFLLSGQQLGQLVDVRHVRRGGRHRVQNPRSGSGSLERSTGGLGAARPGIPRGDQSELAA